VYVPYPRLVGREAELTRLYGLLAEAREHGRSLLIRGEPGIGKSALMETIAARAAAAGWRVLRTAGTPAEKHFPLAALHRLLRPVMSHLAALGAAHRDALRGGFGLADGHRPEIFKVALAALDLLADVATDAPLAVLVDDSHWLDQSSGEVLAFIARRLDSDPVFLLAAGRYTGDDPLVDGTLPELHLGGLNPAAAAALLESVAPDFQPTTRRRLLADARGNPLALIELPKAIISDEYRYLPSGLLSLTGRLERAFAERASGLSAASRDLLLLAALSQELSIAEVLGAGTFLRSSPVTIADLDAAVAAGLLEAGRPTVRFRHPLVRSAIYQSAPDGQRRAAHGALAGALSGDADRHAWHRAASTIGLSEGAAADLEAAALRAQSRGLVPGAVYAFERAAELSVSPAGKGRRLLRAAELAQQAGQGELSKRLLRDVELLPLSNGERLRAEWVREMLDEAMQGGVQQVGALTGLAEEAQGAGDRDLAAQFLLQAAKRCWHINLGPEAGHRVITAVDALGLDEMDPRRIAITGYASSLQRGAELNRLLSRRAPQPGDDPSDLLLLGHAAACAGAFAEAELFCGAAADGLRAQGRLAPLCQALSLLAWAALRRSRWSVAMPAAEECVRLSEETRQPIHRVAGLAAQAMMAAVRGDEDLVRTLTAHTEKLASDTGNTIGLALIQVARATAAAGGGRPAEAYEALKRIYRPDDVAYQRMQACWALGTLAETGVLSGHLREVIAEVTEAARLAAGTPSAGVGVALRHARAALAETAGLFGTGAAEDEFRDALGGDLTDWPFVQGQILLAYGQWLRRRQRVAESRTQLRAARDTFDRIGARPWCERARQELRAAGETSDRPAPNLLDGLTPQEMHIAQLTAQGLGNKEIGERLYLSHRTVQSHLYKIFPKLQVTSRTQLAGVVLASHPDSRDEHPDSQDVQG
jgi:DNA-binding CsgD family transcriptional regulator